MITIRCKIATLRKRISVVRQCINLGTYPVSFCKRLKISGLQSNEKNLRWFAKSFVDADICALSDLQLLHTSRLPTLENLSIVSRIKFMKCSSSLVKTTICSVGCDLESSLTHDQEEPNFPKNPARFVTNLSSTQLSQLQLEALSVGLRYCIPPKKADAVVTQA